MDIPPALLPPSALASAVQVSGAGVVSLVRSLRLRLEGLPTDWALIPANIDEREGAQDVLARNGHLVLLGNKGFIDQNRADEPKTQQGIGLMTPKRRN